MLRLQLRLRSVPTALACALALPASAPAQVDIEPVSNEVRTTASGDRYLAGELLITLADDAGRGAVLRHLGELGGVLLEEVRSLRMLRVRFDASFDVLTQRSLLLRTIPGVTAVELNGVGEGGGVEVIPDDTSFGTQWHLKNTAQNAGTPGADIEATAAWALEQGSSDVVLAVLDTGIDFDHPEFVGRTLPGFDFVNTDADPTADHPHGVNVTGIAAANSDNAYAAASVDWNCTILPVKVLDEFNFGSTFDLIQGLDFCAEQKADVVCMSLINFPGTAGLELALQRARDAGCILMACAGNNGVGNADVSFPGASPRTISIGATTSSDNRAAFSGTGSALDFVAPGTGIRTTSTADGDTVALFSGCSAATPVAAGIVSLLEARFPLLTQDLAYAALLAGAEDQVGPLAEDTPGRDDFFGHGRLNARASLEAVLSGSPLVGYYCHPPTPNSAGTISTLSASGSPVASDNELALRAIGVAPNQFGYFVMGDQQGLTLPPGSSGTLCVVGGTFVRFAAGIQSSGMAGELNDSIGTQGLPGGLGLFAGETWNFQAWYRDGGTSNFSDALSVTFE